MKQILCYGDSNTYGFDGRSMSVSGDHARFDESTRWTRLLQKNLGSGFLVCEEGMNGRTTVFDDPLAYGRNGYSYLEVAFETHQPVDLVVVMLGTNDLKDQFSASAQVIAWGMERLVIRLQELIFHSLNPAAKILLVAPANVRKNAQGGFCYDFSERSVAKGEQLPPLYRALAERYRCAFVDANDWTSVDEADGTHLNPEGHRIFADQIAEVIRSIL